MLESKINRAIHDCEFRLKIIQVRIDRGYGNKETEEMKENVLLEIEALRALEKSMRIKDILGNDYDLDRLRELVQADREGRCAVLPCKLGNKVYFPLLGRIIKKTVYSIVTFSNSQRIYCDGTSEFFRPENFGKTVFLTRAAAEKALEKEEKRNG